MAKHILVVEDDVYIQELIEQFLEVHHYIVDVAENGVQGWEKFQQNPYDLIILDIMLPQMDGYSLCQMIRQASSVPIIILTALSEERDQVKAFELKADDYIAKPFSFNVLVKRVEAVLRRCLPEGTAGVKKELAWGSLRLDLNSYKVYVKGEPVEVTVKEFEIMQTLLENAGRVLTREMLLDRVWGYDYYGDSRTIDAHIKNIRKKIAIPWIKTVKGLGYLVDKEGDAH